MDQLKFLLTLHCDQVLDAGRDLGNEDILTNIVLVVKLHRDLAPRIIDIEFALLTFPLGVLGAIVAYFSLPVKLHISVLDSHVGVHLAESALNVTQLNTLLNLDGKLANDMTLHN
jgi:hypothetical protein